MYKHWVDDVPRLKDVLTELEDEGRRTEGQLAHDDTVGAPQEQVKEDNHLPAEHQCRALPIDTKVYSSHQ
jgi:hypothetical protein